MNALDQENREFFQWLRSLSDVQPLIPDAVDLIQHEMRMRMRLPLQKILQAASSKIDEWKSKDPTGLGLQLWMGRRGALRPSAAQLSQLLEQPEKIYFFNVGRLLCWTWNAAILNVEDEGALASEFEEVQESLAWFRDYAPAEVLRPTFRAPPLIRPGRDCYDDFLTETRLAQQRMKNHCVDLVTLELYPAVNICAGISRLAWFTSRRDEARTKRIVKNTFPLILDWAKVSQLGFFMVRGVTVDRASGLMRAESLSLVEEGSPAERFVLSADAIRKVREEHATAREQYLGHRRNCAALQVTGGPNRRSSVEELLLWSGDVSVHYQSRMR